MANLALATAHADNFWFRPCADDTVWTKTRPINLAQEARAHGKNPGEWVGRFLFYDAPVGESEGLYLIPAAEATLGAIKARGFRADRFPTRIFLCSWPDSHKEVESGLTPKYTGLNDCSHFVSECLKAGGLGAVGSTTAAQLVANLRARADTKTLALNVPKAVARRIGNSEIMAPGDVIAFSNGVRFRHTTLFLGDRKIAMHTSANHPSMGVFATEEKGENWLKSANSSHPLVTLIHFNHADRDPARAPWLPGWWEVTINGSTFFYHFTATGKAAWTSQRPSSLAVPPGQAGGQGYWFVNSDGNVNVCWRDTGTLDFILRPTTPPATTGFSNSGSLTAVRLGP
jgi:hypothetical protein